MDDIVLEREDTTNVMKLDDEETALLNEIEISTEDPAPIKRARPMKRPARPRPRPQTPPQMVHQPDLDAFTNPTKMQAPKKPPPEFVDYGEDEDEDDEAYEEYGADPNDMMGGQGEMPSPGFSTIDDEKADLLNKLTRLDKKGIAVNKKLNIYSNIDELRTEYKRAVYSIEVEQSIKFSRRMLIACTTGLEFLNKRYDPLAVQLDGWSESVMENVDDYDGVFEELYNKYKTKVSVAPEVKLIMMLGGSAMMFHLTNSMFKAAIPNMNDVMKQNPDLVKNMMSAVQNTQARQTMEDPTQRPVETVDANGRREMQGPGLDLSSLMGGIMMPPPPPMSTTQIPPQSSPVLDPVQEVVEDDNESMSDIVSISGESTGGEVKEVKVSGEKKKRRGRPKKTEINI
jgi:hypothetical protein